MKRTYRPKDDGFPDASDYDNNYQVASQRPHRSSRERPSSGWLKALLTNLLSA